MLTKEEREYIHQVLESQRHDWKHALYTISLKTSDKTYKGLCETKIQEIETIQNKLQKGTI